MKKVSLIFLFLISSLSSAQEILTLEECYELAQENYPLARQLTLLEEKTARELEVIGKDYLPKIDLNAKATYQSDVIEIPIQTPQGIDAVDKDQYRATVDVEQLIFNGGKIQARKQLKEAELQAQKQEVKVDLYQIKKRINRYYFTSLQLREQMALLHSKQEVLADRIRELESAVKYGAALPASEDILKAEMLKIDQQKDEVQARLHTAQKSLSAYIAKPVDTATVLELPTQDKLLSAEGTRPENEFFSLKAKELDQNRDLLSKSLYPNIYGFAQGGYGKPGYNMLDNSFQDFYLVGVKLNWNIFDWGKIKEQKRSLDVSKDLLAAERETFNFNNNVELEEAQMKIRQFQQMLEKDRDIITLRERIVEAANSQLTHGVITPSEYLTQFNNLYEARINRQLHELDLEMSKADFRIIKGNTEN